MNLNINFKIEATVTADGGESAEQVDAQMSRVECCREGLEATLVQFFRQRFPNCDMKVNMDGDQP